MLEFIRKYREKTSFTLSGFDRVVFRGLLRSIVHPDGMKKHLSRCDVPRREFGAHVNKTTERLKEASLAEAKRLERPVIYLPSSKTRKETVAKEVLAQKPVDSGLICVLKCVEPCMAYEMYRNKDQKKLELVYRPRKCMHLYHYYNDPVFGLMNARIQTWYPFHVQVCLNGRSFLARRMDEEGCGYTRHENCFTHIEHPELAQRWLDELVRLDWAASLDDIADRLNPAHRELLGPYTCYYWFAHQTEWATDIAFNSPEELQRIYPQLVWGAITTFSSKNVMRFLGKQLQSHFTGEVTSHYNCRPEGLSVKHEVNHNSEKMYDKAGRILRIEATITNPHDIDVHRPAEGGDPNDIAPRAMRKGIADLERRTQVSQRANERYLDALTHLDTDIPLAQLLRPVTKSKKRKGKRTRGIRPWDGQDLDLLRAINRPEFLIGGFRNNDIATMLYPRHQAQLHQKRAASARTSYRLRILREHGLIAKIPKKQRYRITSKGSEIATAILLAQHATAKQLNQKAA